METIVMNPTEVVLRLRSLGWEVATSGPRLTEDLGRVRTRPLFRAWGHPRYPRHYPLYAVAAEETATTIRRLRELWAAGANDIWVLGVAPGLSTWTCFTEALRGVPAGYRVLCARPEELAQGYALAIVSREPAWVAPPRALRQPEWYAEEVELAHPPGRLGR